MPADINLRPERVKTWAYVEGNVVSTTRDLGDKMNKIWDNLRKLGWIVSPDRMPPIEGIGLLGLDHPFSQYMHRLDRSYTPEDAKRAMLNEIGQQGLTGTIMAYAGAVTSATTTATSEVVVQSAVDAARAAAEAARLAAEAGKGAAKAASSGWLPWAIGGALVLGLLAYVSPWLPKPSRQER